MSDHAPHAHGTGVANPAHSKVVSLPTLVTVWFALGGLTVLNLLLARVNLHGFSVAISLLVATAMAIIAAMYFMHLRYDHPLYLSMLILVLIFITIFISFSVHDTLQYKAQLIKGQAPLMVQAAQARHKPSTKPVAPPGKP